MSRCLLGCLLVAVLGCSRSEYPLGPVSGVVTLDGKPLSGARVGFEPIRRGEGPNAGPGSYGTTDAEGRYRLKTIDGDTGAVVGRHNVRLSTFRGEVIPGRDEVKVVVVEKVPDRYIQTGALTFEVPPEGTEAADFDLHSR